MKRHLLIAALLLPTPALAYSPSCIRDTMVREAKYQGYTLTFGETPEGLWGVTRPDRTAVVSDRIDRDTQTHVLFHEMAHIGLHMRGPGRKLPIEQKEKEAAIAAGIALEILRLPPGVYTAGAAVMAYPRVSFRKYETVLLGNTLASYVMTNCTP